MSALVRVTEVRHLGDRRLRVTFSDRLVRELDFAGTLDGVLASIDDDEAFGRVAVARATGPFVGPLELTTIPTCFTATSNQRRAMVRWFCSSTDSSKPANARS